MPPTKQPIRPRAWIPMDDIFGLRTLIHHGELTQEDIRKYYGAVGLDVSQATVSRRIKELKDDEII